MRFKTFYNNQILLNEVLITFGKKAYPKFGNIVILAGGAGSGKGHILKNVLSIEGKVFDVDKLKLLSTKLPSALKKFPELKDLKLKNAEDVFKLHNIVKALGIEDAQTASITKSILSADPDRKPNLIFDVTLKNVDKLDEITKLANNLGYNNSNIHVAWILNDAKIAMEQNMKRSRVVPEDILIQTHEGAAKTMIDLMKNGHKNINGDISVIFNRAKIDAKIKAEVDREGKIKKSKFTKNSVWTIDKALYIKIKEQNKNIKKYKDILLELKEKMTRMLSRNDIKDTAKWFNDVKSGKINN